MNRMSWVDLPEICAAEVIGDRLVVVANPNHATTPEALRAAKARDILLLDRDGPGEPVRRDSHVEGRYRRPSDLARNNCTVAVLNGTAALALANKRFFGHFENVLVPFDLGGLAALPGIARYSSKGRLVLRGTTRICSGSCVRRYLVFQCNVLMRNNRRMFAPTGTAPLDILRSLDGLDYVVLRWIEAIETGTHRGDIDILISGTDLLGLRARLGRSIGTYPMDVYTDGGQDGHTYKGVPYFMPEVARRALKKAVSRPSGIRAPNMKWRYLLFCYHLLFHNKSEKVPAGTEKLSAEIFPEPKYLAEIGKLAEDAGRMQPRTFSDLEAALLGDQLMPGIDLIGFYSVRNPFLKARYLAGKQPKPGLSVFYVRDFGDSDELAANVRNILNEHFHILAEGPVTPDIEPTVLEKVRGGNWFDEVGAAGEAKPVYWFVCWDQFPIAPSRLTRRKHPRVDNENIRVKARIRQEAGSRKGRFERLVHSSDNTREAIEHIKYLGLADHAGIREIVASLSTDGRG